jgi:hypothetical protein
MNITMTDIIIVLQLDVCKYRMVHNCYKQLKIWK